MRFHHLGIATDDLESGLEFVKRTFTVKKIHDEIYDEKQRASLVLIETEDLLIELVCGKAVESYVKRGVTYYHVCYEVDDMAKALETIEGMTVSPPKEAVLFGKRRVAFVMTPLGMVELLESRVGGE